MVEALQADFLESTLDLDLPSRLRCIQTLNSKRIDALCRLRSCASLCQVLQQMKKVIKAQLKNVRTQCTISSWIWSKQLSCGRSVCACVLASAFQHEYNEGLLMVGRDISQAQGILQF